MRPKFLFLLLLWHKVKLWPTFISLKFNATPLVVYLPIYYENKFGTQHNITYSSQVKSLAPGILKGNEFSRW